MSSIFIPAFVALWPVGCFVRGIAVELTGERSGGHVSSSTMKQGQGLVGSGLTGYTWAGYCIPTGGNTGKFPPSASHLGDKVGTWEG